MQVNTGSGDNVRGPKIERQVNNPGTYIEAQYYGTPPMNKPLHIMVVSKVISEIDPDPNFSSLRSIYGDAVRKWKPFDDETIEHVLGDFQQKTGFSFTDVSYLDECEDTDDFLDENKNETIFILDGLTNCDFSKNLDSTHDEIAGFVILINRFYDDNLLSISQEYFKGKWKKYYERITKPCLNIEICVSTKELLFRRLTNFAKLKGIEFSKSKTQIGLIKKYSQSGAASIDVTGNNI